MADNPAIADHPLLPVYALNEAAAGAWAPGGAARWRLHHALAARGAPPLLVRGSAAGPATRSKRAAAAMRRLFAGVQPGAEG